MARNKNKALFQDLTAEGPEAETPAPATRRRSTGYLGERESHLTELVRGDRVEKTYLWVEPERCRMWVGHNRRYELLTADRCQDLIEGFLTQGHQEFPAIVRRLEAGDTHDFEVVCGARRHWTVAHLRENNYPEFKFLIEVRDLSDEEAFRLSDIENRDKEDISDYERATDYMRALKEYYGTQKKMAQRLQVSPSWLSEYLALGDLPDEIVTAFPDVTTILLQHGRELRPFLKDRRERVKLLRRAKDLSARQALARKGEGELLAAREVVLALKGRSGGGGRQKVETLGVYEASTGNPMLTVKRGAADQLALYVHPPERGGGRRRSWPRASRPSTRTSARIHDRELFA